MSAGGSDEGPEGKRPARRWTFADQAYEQILTLIIEGEFPHGSRLPTEVAMSERLGVSRPVLRQALKRLREDGIVTSQQGSGSFVQRRPDRAVLKFAPVGSIADIQRTFEFRATIEPQAAALAAERWTGEQMSRIKRCLAELDTCLEEGRVGTTEDEELHLAICEATDNHYFVSARASMKDQILEGMQLARRLTLSKPRERLERVQREHYVLIGALDRRDAVAARDAMLAHIENARARVFDGID